ncbi:DMT family transporter [Pseudaestuariivita sp.]|uniref:DMT family transporter n=1 Tax=Pseudaestuariivita sp. TaxID=2211669 RepID=UPI004058E067
MPNHSVPLTPPPEGQSDLPRMQRRRVLGIATMAFGFFLFAMVDSLAKYLTDHFHPLQIVWSRQLGLLTGVLILLALKGASILRTEHRRLQITRGVLAALSAALFIYAVKYVPVADAVAISFVAPFIVTLLGALVLGETVGLRRWIAVTIGFVGALIIIRPGMGVMHPAGMLVVLAATLFALRQILSRTLAGADSTLTTVAYTAIASSAVLSVPVLFVWQTPEWGLPLALLVTMAVIAAVGETLIIRALELAEAVVLAPLHYTILIWATFYGWLIFDDLPDVWTWVGAAVIVVSGLYTLHRERLAKAR